jgi:hypothetical protein
MTVVRITEGQIGGITQVVEHLPSKDEALNSNPRTAKKRKKNHIGL